MKGAEAARRAAEDQRIRKLIYQLQLRDALGITPETSEHGRLHRDSCAAEVARKAIERATNAARMRG